MKFDWKKHLDEKNDDFFREGEYVPPAPFMEVARNPSDENIRFWLSYLDKKNTLAERLRSRIAEYSLKNASPKFHTLAGQVTAQLPQTQGQLDPARFRIRMYFESTCPHCKRMMGTLRALQDEGIFIEALQIDGAQLSESAFPVATARADPEDVKKQGISSVPFTLIADLKTKTVLKPITGFKTASEMKDILRQLARTNN